MRSITVTAKASGLSPQEIEKVRSVLRNPELAAKLEHIVSRGHRTATEIIERAETATGILNCTDIRFKADNGKEYYLCVNRNKPGNIYNSLAYQVYTELFPYNEPSEEELISLTDDDYLKYLNIDSIKKQWVEDVE